MSFIGIAINIWRNTKGTGGGGLGDALKQRDDSFIFQRNSQPIYLRDASFQLLPTFFFDGDSMTADIPPQPDYPEQFADLLSVTDRYANFAVVGSQVSGMEARALATYDAYYNPIRNNILLGWGGLNNLFDGQLGADIYAEYSAYCLERKNIGFKMVAFTLPSCDPGLADLTQRLAYNALIRANYLSFADALVDLESNSLIGTPTAYLDTNYFYDGVHMTVLGNSVVASMASTAVEPFI